MSNLVIDLNSEELDGIRKVWIEEENQYYFVIIDVIQLLIDTENISQYWYKMKKREEALIETIKQFPMKHKTNGRIYQTDCANREGLFRIIQSIPSPKAEPFKRWLAKIGNERIQELENPSLAIERIREMYRLQGRDDEWIETRIQALTVRNELTDEWRDRGVQDGPEFAMLTSEISKGTFGLTPAEHRALKNLRKEGLRDHMTKMELILMMLGEESTKTLAKKADAQGFDENQQSAMKGGRVAGEARKMLEEELQEPVVSSDNFVQELFSPQKKLIPDPNDPISAEQANTIKKKIEEIAFEIEKQTNEHAQLPTFKKFCNYFQIDQYKNLPKGKYDEAIEVVDNWYGSLFES